MKLRTTCDTPSQGLSSTYVQHTNSIAWLLLMLFLAGYMPAMSLEIEIPFGCTPYQILNSSSGAFIGMCDSSIVMYMGQPIPPKAAGVTRDQPVRLGMESRTADGTQDSLIDIPIDIAMDTESGLITLKPLVPFTVYDGRNSMPALYKIIVYCRWWKPDDFFDSTFVYISKQNVLRYRTESRRLSDSTLIEPMLTTPLVGQAILDLDSLAMIDLVDQTDGYTFDHWTSSHGDMPVVPEMRNQNVIHGCFPASDTIIYTAWFKTTSDVYGDDTNEGATSVHWGVTNQTLSVEGLAGGTSQLTIYDVHGSVVFTGPIERSQLHIQLRVQPGVHLAVIKQGARVITTHFLAY